MRSDNGLYPECRLKELISLEYGDSLPNEDRLGGHCPVMGSNGIVGYHDKPKVNGPGIVVGRKGSIGQVTWVSEDFWPIDTTYYVEQKTRHDRHWLYYLLEQLHLEKLNSATGVPGLNREDAYALSVPVPTEVQSREIAEIIQAIDDAIEATQAVIKQTRQLKTALLQDLLTNGLPGKKKAFKEIAFVGKVPRHWNLTSLSEVAVEGRGNFVNGPFGSDLLTSDFVPEGVPVLYIQDIQSGAFKRVSNVYVTEKKARELDFCSIVPGDVLLTKVGDPPCTAAVYPASEPNAIITQDVIRIRPNRRVVEPLFLKTVLNSWIGKTQVRRILITGTRDRVSLGDFKRVSTLLPPLEEQREISRLTESIDTRLDKAQLHSSRLALTKAALSQGLLTGRIPVTGREEAA